MINIVFLRNIHTKIVTKIEQLQSAFLLSLVYILGIGTTSLVAKMFRKKFIPTIDTARGSWTPKKTTETNIKMY